MGAGMHRVAVDVGGTFTDIVIANADGSCRTLKLLSTPDDYSRAIIEGLRRLSAEGDIDAASVGSLVHAFTVATNALLTGEGAKIGLITTRGFRDVLEIARLRMPQLYDMDWDKPRPLVPRRRRFEVDERIGSNGEVVRSLDEASVLAAIKKMRVAEVDAVAICLLHSYANPSHEQAVADLIRRKAPDLSISVSHQVLPELREFERTSTTVVNAFVKPTVDRYLGRLESKLKHMGIAAPLMVMQSAGGITKADTAREFPAFCLESGPAAGAIGAAALGQSLDEQNIIAFDMGGTTAKACLIEGGEPRIAQEMEVGAGINVGQRLLKGGGYLVRSPTIDLAEVGAGGGSLAWVDGGGVLRVGPRSAGSDPGPACYGRGGRQPTVTDANVVLGFLNPVQLLDGEMPIDARAACEVITSEIGKRLDLAPHEAAHGIHVVANATMARAIQAVSSEIGRSPADFTLIAFGGSGPVHAATLAAHAGISEIIVPPAPGVFSALGLLFSRIQHRLVRTYWHDVDKIDYRALNHLAATLLDEARELMGNEGALVDDIELKLALDMRYAGQSSELAIEIADPPVSAQAIQDAVERFHQEHERTYDYCSRHEPVQIVNLRLRARGRGQAEHALLGQPVHAVRSAASSKVKSTYRKAYFGASSGWVETPILRRLDLTETAREGPLIVEEYDTTIVVPPGSFVRLASGLVRINVSHQK